MRKQKTTEGLPLAGNPRLDKRLSRQKEEQSKKDAANSPSRKRGASPRQQRKGKRGGLSLRAGVAVLAGQSAGMLSRRLHVGGGTSIAGLVAQRVDPGIVDHLAAQLEQGSIMITGTNGKTTTSGLIAAILNDAGLRVWHNREGSNLMGGIASLLVGRASATGNLRSSGQAISVLEIDEAVVPQIVERIPARVVVFTNLFRDQLDRYGEVDTVASRWQEAVSKLPEDTTLVLNADDPATAYLGNAFRGKVLYFGIDDPELDLTAQMPALERHQAIDSRTCPKCGNDYTYTLRFYSHSGHYFCPNCGNARPRPNIRAVKVQSDEFDRLRLRVSSNPGAESSDEEQTHEIVVPLPGLYNVYNALAAITVAQALHIGWEPTVTGIEQFKPAFGRGERVQIEGRTLRLLLAKNPTGMNEVLRTLFSESVSRNVLFMLNDKIADGRDVSWIWDVDFERAVGQTATLVVGGTRALDLGLRLKYAGVAQEQMLVVPGAPLRAARKERSQHSRIRPAKKNTSTSEVLVATETERVEQTADTDIKTGLSSRYGIEAALDEAVRLTPVGETLFVVPTYTALLELHRILERRSLTPHFWEEGNGKEQEDK
jgi:UDP-N-acetylmuramyl tripeptide synthase